MPSRIASTPACCAKVPISRATTPRRLISRRWSTYSSEESKRKPIESLERVMAHQVELAPAGVASRLRDGKEGGAAVKAKSRYSAKRLVTTFGVALLFTLAVLFALNYF